MSFWWGYALGSYSRGGGNIGEGLFGLIFIGVIVAGVWEVMKPSPPKEISMDDYKGLIVAAGASCTGLSVVSHHMSRPGRIKSDKLSPIQDLLVDRIQHGDRTICGIPPRPAAIQPGKSAKVAAAAHAGTGPAPTATTRTER